jgi:hypothetical protein
MEFGLEILNICIGVINEELFKLLIRAIASFIIVVNDIGLVVLYVIVGYVDNICFNNNICI